MLGSEAAHRDGAKRARLLRQARFPVPKALDGFDWSNVAFPDGWGRDEMCSLAFVRDAEDLASCGQTGRGKTHMATALGIAATSAGCPAGFWQTAQLVPRLGKAKREGAPGGLLTDVAKARLLVLNEFGHVPFDVDGVRPPCQVISESYERRSAISAANVESGRWGTVFADDKLAAAIVGRVARHGRLVESGGPSHRLEESLMLGKSGRQGGAGGPVTKPEKVPCTDLKEIHAQNLNLGLTKHSLPTALLRLFNPERSNHTRAEERLNKLQGFVRDVMNDPCTSLLVSHESHEISLKTSDAGYLPLDSLGTGVTELVILASIIACNDNRIICIEEPEIHLHPALQARFMKYLLEDDSNRFIITTHSPTVINYPGVQVAHVSKANGVSRCKQLDGLGCARDLLDDLGVKASDLLQASFIVWVEGPSDRIYLTYWIKRWSDEHNISLEEGIHYSVMIYGGKLLNALDASTCGDVPAELIALFRINTHFCVLIDSDKKSSHSGLSSTKHRIVDECVQSGAMSWVTWGATIENYIPEDVLVASIKKCYPDKKWEHSLGDRFICPLSFTFKGKTSQPSKIKIARTACRFGFSPLSDAMKKVGELCDLICAANDVETR